MECNIAQGRFFYWEGKTAKDSSVATPVVSLKLISRDALKTAYHSAGCEGNLHTRRCSIGQVYANAMNSVAHALLTSHLHILMRPAAVQYFIAHYVKFSIGYKDIHNFHSAIKINHSDRLCRLNEDIYLCSSLQLDSNVRRCRFNRKFIKSHRLR